MRDETDKARTATSDLAKQKQAFEDLQNELAGNETGRLKRFLGADDPRTAQGRRKKQKDERLRRTLRALLQDAEYARLHQALGDRLADAEQRADQTLQRLTSALSALDQQIEKMERQAARDPDGHLVFLTASGAAVYADGRPVPDEIADGLHWPAHAPSAEAYFAAIAQTQALTDDIQAITEYRMMVLGGIRDRYDDPDNPFQSKDALKEALEDIERKRPELSALEAPKMTELPAIPTASHGIAVPTHLN